MNELDLIRSFRRDMPPAGPAAVARAERAWQGRQRPPRWTPRLVLAGCLVAAATVAALVIPAERDGRLGAPEARAAQTLRAAAAAEGGLTRPLRPGEYWYVRQRTAWAMSAGDDYVVIHPEVREDWVAIDGSRRWRTRRDGEPRFPTPEDRERWEEAGGRLGPARTEHRVPAPKDPPFYVGDRALTYAQLLELPRDPEALYERLRSAAIECECGQSVEQETFVIVGDLLRGNPIPADLRAALLRAAAHVPGIEFVERERDLAGRTGVGVAFESEGQRSVLIFDRDTYELLGENEYDGALIGGSADVESGVVASIEERP
jgi:hypothetical protein